MAERIVCPYGCGKEWVGTANRRADTPLDPDATRAANEATWSNCPRLTSADGTRRQLTMEADDAFCRRVWMDAYIEARRKTSKKQPPKPKVDPKDPVLPCEKANLVVRVSDDKDGPVERATVVVDGLGSLETNADGYADFGEVNPGSYHITAEKAHHSPGAGQVHGPTETTKDVPRCTTTLARLTLVQTCKSIYLKKPFLIAQATDKYLSPTVSQPVNDDILYGAPLGFGQDITHATGRTAPGGESVGTTASALDAKMRRLLGEFAANDKTGMAKRLLDDFLSKKSSIVVFSDPSLDAAISTHTNFVSFANRAVSAPGTPGADKSKTRIHQALQAAGWDVNAVKPITDLGVPAFNIGSKVRGTDDFGNGLGVMINGVQYVVVYVEEYEYHSCTEEYRIKLKFALYDVFGLDDDDLREFGAADDSFYHSTAAIGITAWWQLQHQFDYAPLLTRGVVELEYNVSTK
ncbi:MAG: carboxypeptidase-like regulatory domain-containing protein [Verrucomicrobiota bacterium]